VVLGANTADLYFRHQRGKANVKLKYLNPDLQKKFGYDPKAAAEEEKKQSELDARYQKDLEMSIAAETAVAKAASNKQRISSEDNLADPISVKSLLGKPAPALDVEKWFGDKPIVEGKFVLLSFWAPWSFPSRKCIPDLNALQKRFPKELAVVGVCSESEAEIAEMAEPKPEFPSAVDPRGQLVSAMGITSVPCVLLLDPKRIVEYQGHPSAITEKKPWTRDEDQHARRLWWFTSPADALTSVAFWPLQIGAEFARCFPALKLQSNGPRKC